MNIAIEDLTGEQAKKLLLKIVDKLEELSEDDFFGTEGWEHFFNMD